MLIKHENVLDRNPASGAANVYFLDTEPPEGEKPLRLYFPRDLWEMMGKPEKVTVTVQPGDRLNVEGAGDC